METGKIISACFIGGVLCCSVALIFSPNFWWIGLGAGFIGGYISLEFREAYYSTKKVLLLMPIGQMFKKVRAELGDPYIFVSIFFAIPVVIVIQYLLSSEEGFLFLKILFGLLSFLGSSLVIIILEEFGEKHTNIHLYYPTTEEERDKAYEQRKKTNGSYSIQPLTTRYLLRNILGGIWISIIYLMIGIWNDLFYGIKRAGIASVHFIWNVFKLIHSKKRLLCGIDGTIGGGVSYFLFHLNVSSFPEQIMMVFFGGLIGAGFGILNWEVVSKRLLHLNIVKNSIN